MSETLKDALIRVGSSDQVSRLSEEAQNATKADFVFYLNNGYAPDHLSSTALGDIYHLAYYRLEHSAFVIPWEEYRHFEKENPPDIRAGW